MKKKRTLNVLLLVVLVGAVTTTAVAQQAVKVAVVNSQQVLEKSTEGKKVMTQLTQRDNKIKSDIARMDQEITQLETKLNTQRMTLSEEALIQLNSDLEKKRTDRRRFAEDANKDIQEYQFRLYQKLQNELLPIIEQIGKEKGYDIIFDLGRSGAVYWNPAVDITEEVIRKYDASKVPGN